MQRIKQSIAIGMLAFAFWGVMYPQFSLVQDTYVCMEDVEQNPEKDFFHILDAGYGKIKMKSKLWEIICNSRKNGCL